MPYCPHCGSENAADAKFCLDCGESLTPAAQSDQSGARDEVATEANESEEDYRWRQSRLAGEVTLLATLFIPAIDFFSPLFGGLVAGYVEGNGREGGRKVGDEIGRTWYRGVAILITLVAVLLLIVALESSIQGWLIAVGVFLYLVVIGLAKFWLVYFAQAGGIIGGALQDKTA